MGVFLLRKRRGSGVPYSQALPVRRSRFLFMRKFVKIIYIFLILSFLAFNFTVFADDNIEEELDWSEIESEIKSANSEANEVPSINSRHAIVIDRTSRKSFIWKKGKRKMQNGIYHKNTYRSCGYRKCRQFKSKDKSVR